MNYYLLFSVLIITAFAQTDLQSQYCTLKTNTTGEIIIGVSASSQSRASTEFIMRTQSYVSSAGIVSLSYIEDQGSLSIEETDSLLTTKVHSDNTENTLVYIDSRNQYILAKQITDQQTAQFDYVLFTATISTAGSMTKFTISSEKDSAENDISALKVVKIIEVSQTQIYIILSGSNSSSLYKLSTQTEGNLVFYADLSSTQELSIEGGNHKYLYDSVSNSFYELNETSGVSYASKSFSELGIDSILTSSSLEFTNLEGFVLAYSENNEVSNILPIDLSTIDPSETLSISGTPSIWTDNYKNFLAITTADLLWLRVTDAGLVSVKLSTTSLNSTVQDQILEIFNLAQLVSFNDDSAVIVKQEPSKTKASLYSITFDPSGAQVLTVLDEYINSISSKTGTYTNVISPSSVSGFQTSFTCNCVSPQVQRIDCYASGLKCVAKSYSKREVCTKE